MLLLLLTILMVLLAVINATDGDDHNHKEDDANVDDDGVYRNCTPREDVRMFANVSGPGTSIRVYRTKT